MIDSKENYKFDLGVKGLLEIKSLYRFNHKKKIGYTAEHTNILNNWIYYQHVMLYQAKK